MFNISDLTISKLHFGSIDANSAIRSSVAKDLNFEFTKFFWQIRRPFSTTCFKSQIVWYLTVSFKNKLIGTLSHIKTFVNLINYPVQKTDCSKDKLFEIQTV